MMKQTLLAGILMMGLTAQAAPAGGLKVEMTKYLEETVKPSVFGRSGSPKGFAATATEVFKSKLSSQLEISDAQRATIKDALQVGGSNTAAKVEQRLLILAELAGARKIAEKYIQEGNSVEEAKSIKAAAKAMTSTIANSAFKSNGRKSELLNESELKLANEALDKMESIGGLVVKMDRESRDLFTEVETKRAELLDSGRLTGEEALLQSIMETKKCSREKAIQIMERLKKCV